ncbi:amino acid adenylation domain-containing protein [Rhodococcus cerastii]|nr:amino acid adenylation domain-containing protein [Rhodococcus cerastii]
MAPKARSTEAMSACDPIPLSQSQRGMWAAQLLFPGSSAFRVGRLMWFDGAIDSGAFAAAVSYTFSETESLQVRFTDEAGEPSQVIREGVSLDTEVFTQVHSDDEIRAAVRAVHGQSGTIEDSTVSLLFRRNAGGWAWCFMTNSLMLDGYGYMLVTRRVAEVYSSMVNQTAVPPRQFGHLADLTTHPTPEQASRAVNHWREVLSVDVDPASTEEIPLADLFAYSYDPNRLGLPVDFGDRLERLAQNAQVAWTDALIAVWGLYTALVEGRDYLAVRVPLMLREGSRAIRKTPCAVARALPVVVTMRPDSSFAEVFGAVASQVKEMRQYIAIEDYELGRLWTGQETSYLSLPTINIKVFEASLDFDGLEAHSEPINPGPTGLLDLSVHGTPRQGLRLDLSGRSPLVSAEAAYQHSVTFAAFLDTVISSPGDVSLHQLASRAFPHDPSTDAGSWSVGAEVVVGDVTVDSLVCGQVGRSPGAVAVVDDVDGGELSYAGFDSRVNALAQLLVDRGVSVGDRVAVVLPRGVDLVVVLCAVMRAGAAYVPVDPEYPGERVAAIVEDSAAGVVVTDAGVAGVHRDVFGGAGVVVLDEEPVRGWVAAGRSEPPVLSRSLTSADSAYVIFTSGTTGRPKGVVLSHGAVVNRLLWGRDELGYTSADRVLLKTPVTFDVSVPEFFLPLIVGATVVVAADKSHGDPDYIARVLRDREITSVHFVPSMLQAFLDSGVVPGLFPSVRIVSFTGEALPAAAAIRARQVFGSARLFNLYGPTEAAIEITSYDVSELADDAELTPIGAPITNSFVRILDGWLRPVPVGVTGELYLGGVQLADGYAGRPGLTAARFVADPFTVTGERLYRTGDVVRWNRRGELEYLGRSDDQVKVRGFRIELDEIRSVLERHESVSGAAVVAREHPAGGMFLAAFITAADIVGDSALFDDLRRYLAERLPEYMVPATFMRIDVFPVTVSGKLDRKSLPEPDFGEGVSGSRAPESVVERVLADIFRDVLRRDSQTQLSVDDDFFHLGGHSLLATRVVARVNADLGSALTLRDVFDHPTVGGLARILADAPDSTTPMLRIGDLPRPDVIPASYGQQALWVIDALGGPSNQYVVPTVMRLVGNIDSEALATAVRDVLNRHETLRTVLVADDGTVRQVLVPAEQIHSYAVFASEDLTGASEHAVETRVEQVIQSGFDLAVDVPFRARLLRAAGAQWILVLVVHHHAIDEWSQAVLLRDLSTAYRARMTGEPPNWAPMRVQYADYALWERHVLGDPADPGAGLARHLEYWKNSLAGVPEESTLTPDRPRPGTPTHHGEDIAFTIEEDTVAGLQRVADARNVSIFMIVQTAVALAASILGSGNDIVIGSPVGGRTEDGLEDLVGYFVNTIPIRHRFWPSDTVSDALDRTRKVVLDGFAHQTAPFEQIATAVGAERSANRNPLFQIMLTHRMIAGRQRVVDFPGVQVHRRPASIGAVKTDLDLYVFDSSDQLTGFVGYSTELFDRATIERFLTVLRRVLAAIATDPGARIIDMDLLPTQDIADMGSWSVGAEVVVGDVTVDSLVCGQVGRSPGAVAVVDDVDGGELSYAGFDSRVNALAQLLVDRGVSVGDRVAVVLPRGVDLVVVLCAVMRAGAAYVPVDPEYPGERVAAIVEDSAAGVVVTDAGVAGVHRDVFGGAGVVVLDEEPVRGWVAAGRSEPPVLSRSLTSADSAYVIFTSGTTGRPKGVVLSHGAVVNRLLWGRDELGYTSADRVLLKTPVTFDVSVPEFFLPLIVGATVVVAADKSHGDPDYIARVLRDREITSVHFVPSMLQAFLDSGVVPGLFPSVRIVSFTGEALPAAAAIRARQVFGSARLFNLYGPTEAAIEITSYDVSELADDAELTPIGAPITNSFVRILDGWLRPVPVGVTGELYLGGVQLADGYAGRPGLTAARFVADPFTVTGERLYRTGDVVRWNRRGELEYLGRSDDQVKVRGFRIELDEIRSVLERHESVSGAAVVAREHPAGGMFLAAFITAADIVGDSALFDDLRRYLAERLPEYMVPATFMRIDVFPVTVSGKLDRKSLPEPDFGEGVSGSRAPESVVERVLADIFRDVLRRDSQTQLSVDDDFFHLGGHSLLATRVVARVNADLGSALTLRDVFDHPTVGGLARILADAPDSTTPMLRIGDLPRPDVIPASYGQQALWVTEQVANRPIFRFPVALRAQRRIDGDILERAVRRLLHRHEILRTTFAFDDESGALTQQIHAVPGDEAPFVSVERASAGDLGPAVIRFTSEPFDLTSEFGLRFHLVRGEEDDVLVAAGHHTVIDQQSVGPFLRDLNAIYLEEADGVAPMLDAPPVQYADFTLWHRALLGDRHGAQSRFRTDLDYWHRTLCDAPSQIELPLDHPRSEKATRTVRRHALDLLSNEDAAVDELLVELRATPLQALVVALALALWTEGSGTTIPVGSPVSLRDRPELTDAIGYLVNTVVIRTDVDPSMGFAAALQSVRERTLDAEEHKFVPFESVVEVIDPPRTPGVSPLFQVMAAYIDQQESTADQDAPFALITPAKGDNRNKSQPAIADLVFSIARTGRGLTLNLNATRELFDETTSARLLRKVDLFLTLGSKYPELATVHLAQLVRTVLDGDRKPNPPLAGLRPVFGCALTDFEIGDAPMWRAAIEQVAVASGMPTLDLHVLDDGSGELVAATDNPVAVDRAREIVTQLTTAFRSPIAMTIGRARTSGGSQTSDELAALLEDPRWDDWVDRFVDAPEGSLVESDAPPAFAASIATVLWDTSEPSIDPDSALVSVLAAVAKALPVSTEGDGLLIEVRESAGATIVRDHPVFIDEELLARLEADPRGVEPNTVLGLTRDQAAEYSALSCDPELSRYFDELPQPSVRIGLFTSDARRLAQNARADGAEVEIRVLVGTISSAAPRTLRVEVETAAGVEIDPQVLADCLAALLSSPAVTLNIVEELDAPALVRADRLPLSQEEEARIRRRYGTDAEIQALSTLQRGIFYHMVRARESDDHNSYLSQASSELSGAVDVERMIRAVNTTIRRYPNLRAAFVPSGEVQVIPAEVHIPFKILMFEEWTALGRDLREFLAEDRRQRFDFETAPLIRFMLIEHAHRVWTLVTTFEHILLDGWSLNAFLAEILEIYADPTYDGRVAPASFRTYLDWLGTRDPEVSTGVWGEYLEGLAGPVILWPEGGDLGAVRGETGELHHDLEENAAKSVFRAARSAGVTVATVVQAAWGITLGRLTGAQDVVFGNTVSGRPAELADADRIIGLLFNTVPMRVRVSPFETVRQLLTRVQFEQLRVIDHSEAPLTTIQRAAGMKNLFDTLFVVQNHPFGVATPAKEWAGVKLLDMSVDDATHYPVTFAVNPWEQDGSSRVHVRMSYRRDAFDEATAERVLKRYVHVLGSLVAQLDRHVGVLSALLPTEVDPRTGPRAVERRELSSVTVADLLDEQVRRSPSETALVAGARSYTFSGFAAEVNRYARLLLERGVRPEHTVALLLPRDERMVIAMFAVFAVGGAYVPVDTELPDARIEYMLDVATPTVTLVTERDSSRLSRSAGRLIDLDDCGVREHIEALSAEPVTNEERGGEISLDHLAYVIFTSGSTGHPKGVSVGYRGLTNMYINHVEKIFDHVSANQDGRRLRIAHTTSFSFDASWEQLFWLLNGHAVYIIDESMRRDPQRLLTYYDRERIDGFDVTPSYGQVLVDEGLLERDRPAGRLVADDAPGVVFVSLGGEAVPERLWQELRNAPGVESYNLYGPTEYTINALGADLSDSATPSVGVPILNTRAYVLDENLQSTLPGVAGELYLAGAGIARGYWRRSALTAERFVACPWERGERMYRTGDLARWNREGHIDYLGRVDEQVKIRGYRIEPDEVRTVVEAQPLVTGAAVVAAEHPSGGKFLAAYFTAVEEYGADQIALRDQVRRFVAERLPEYMVPTSYVRIEAFPLTPNGKLNTRALPAPDLGQSAAPVREPETDAERTLMGIVRDVLRLNEGAEFSVDDDFFRLGGDSILSIQLVWRARSAGMMFTAADVFSARTVAALARISDEQRDLVATTPVESGHERLLAAVRVSIVPAEQARSLFTVHPIEGFALVYSALTDYLPSGMGLVGLQDPAHAGADVDLDTRERVAALYADAIQASQPEGPYDLLGWSLGGRIAFSVGQELVARGERVSSLTIVDTFSRKWGGKAGLAEQSSRERPTYKDRDAQARVIEQSRDRWRGMLGLEEHDEGADEVMAAMAISTLRGASVMATPTAGVLGVDALLIATGTFLDSESNSGEGTGSLLWGPHLRSCDVVRVDGEDHYSIMDRDTGIPKWGKRLTDYLARQQSSMLE